MSYPNLYQENLPRRNPNLGGTNNVNRKKTLKAKLQELNQEALDLTYPVINEITWAYKRIKKHSLFYEITGWFTIVVGLMQAFGPVISETYFIQDYFTFPFPEKIPEIPEAATKMIEIVNYIWGAWMIQLGFFYVRTVINPDLTKIQALIRNQYKMLLLCSSFMLAMILMAFIWVMWSINEAIPEGKPSITERYSLFGLFIWGFTTFGYASTHCMNILVVIYWYAVPFILFDLKILTLKESVNKETTSSSNTKGSNPQGSRPNSAYQP